MFTVTKKRGKNVYSIGYNGKKFDFIIEDKALFFKKESGEFISMTYNSSDFCKMLAKTHNVSSWRDIGSEFCESIQNLYSKSNGNLTVKGTTVYIDNLRLVDFLNASYIRICPICGDHYIIGSADACASCKRKFKKCAICGEYHYKNKVYKGKTYCTVCFNNTFVQCHECNKIYKKTEFTGTICENGHAYCEDCVENIELWYCSNCGKVTDDIDELTYIDEEYYCNDCRDSKFARCDDCGEYISRNNIIGTENGNDVCMSCYEDHYFTCDDCGEVFHTDYMSSYDDTCICQGCYDEHHRHIHAYNYTPDLQFFGNGPRFFGMEIETDNGDNAEKYAEKIETENDNFFYCMHDGSLNSNGVEIATMPATIDFLKSDGKNHLENLYKTAREYRYLSHDTDTCGLHIHVSRTGINQDTIEKIVYIYEKCFSGFLKLSRRKLDSLNSWARRYFDEFENLTIDAIKYKLQNIDKYRAVNLMHNKTIEFRFFRGTINTNTILASVELIDNLVYFAENVESVEYVTIKDIILTKKTDYLVEYAKKRGICVE